MNTCKTCFYWDSKIDGGETLQIRLSVDPKDTRTVIGGRCRCHAPREHFPWTREDDWCGEFRPILPVLSEIETYDTGQRDDTGK